MSTRKAWIIDNTAEDDAIRYLTFDNEIGMFVWVEDINSALHFSRKEDTTPVVQNIHWINDASCNKPRIAEHTFDE